MSERIRAWLHAISRSRRAAVSWTLLIVALCLIPGTEVPNIDIVGIDKVVHVLMFAVFAVLWWRLVSRRRVLWLLCAGIALAVGTELMQGALALGRVSDPFDVLADILGVCLGLAWASRWLRS